MKFPWCHWSQWVTWLTEKRAWLDWLGWGLGFHFHQVLARTVQGTPNIFCFQTVEHEGEKWSPFHKNIIMFYKWMPIKVELFQNPKKTFPPLMQSASVYLASGWKGGCWNWQWTQPLKAVGKEHYHVLSLLTQSPRATSTLVYSKIFNALTVLYCCKIAKFFLL